MNSFIRLSVAITLASFLTGCAEFYDRMNGNYEQEEHIIVVVPAAPAPPALPPARTVSLPPQPTQPARVVSNAGGIPVVNGNLIPTVRVLPKPITIDAPYRTKEPAAAEQPAAEPPVAPKPSEVAPKAAAAEVVSAPPPPPPAPVAPAPVVAEVKPAAPPPPPPPPVPVAVPVPPVAIPAPAAPLPKVESHSETPNPDSQGGLLARRALYYEFDAANLSDEYKAIVIAHAKYLAKNEKARVKLRGNCDERGSREYNISLGSKRAESVKQLMIANGASAKQIETESFGKEKPMALGHDEQAWAKNRRVDILYGEEE